MLVGLSRVPMATAEAEMSLKPHLLTVFACEPCEKATAFDPMCAKVPAVGVVGTV